MSRSCNDKPFRPVRIAVLTVSDTRGIDEDTAGDLLSELLQAADHSLATRELQPDDVYRLRATLSAWIADPMVECVLINGGTGATGRDNVPRAVQPLLDREIPGFGELFRYYSLEEIGTSALQSRAFAGVANATLIVALPGSPGACRTAWQRILSEQLDARVRPCNFAELWTGADGEPRRRGES